MNHNTKRSGRGRVKEGGRMRREEERRGIRRSRRERERDGKRKTRGGEEKNRKRERKERESEFRQSYWGMATGIIIPIR